MINNKIICFFCCLFILACSKDKLAKVFILPNGEVFEQSSIKNIEIKYPCKFEQYRGFVSKYNDSILKSFVLLIQNNNSVIGNDVVSKEKIKELKFEKVEAIEFQFKPGSNFSGKFDFDMYIKKKYPTLKKVKISEKTFFLKKEDVIFCKVDYYDIAEPTFLLTIYPVRFVK